jgi:NADPH-dependent curcumin reductase CurA
VVGGGKNKILESIINGLENAPEAFFGLFRPILGENFGKLIVDVS